MSDRSEQSRTAQAGKCRILLVDDHPLMREGLSSLIESENDLVVCGQAGDAADAMRQIEANPPDVAVIDIFLPGSTNGIELTKSIAAKYPEVKILILSMHDDPVYIERAFKAGARGYVTKAQVARVILDAIRSVREGRKYRNLWDPAEPDSGVEGAEGKDVGWGGVGRLTAREFEVLELFGRGFTRKGIAERFQLSVKTVEAHREHMRAKMGLKSAGELLRYAMKWVERTEGSGGGRRSKRRSRLSG